MKKIVFTICSFLFFLNEIGFGQAPAIEWQKSLGGSKGEEAWSIQQTADGGYILGGGALSSDGDLTFHYGTTVGFDGWIVKLDAAGNLQWQKSLGGTDDDFIFSVIQTSDGGYIGWGYTYSNDGDVSFNHGAYDCWIVKLDAAGELIWEKTYGGTSSDDGYRIMQTSDGGYIAVAQTQSNDGDVTGHHGVFNDDYWVIRLDENGNLLWEKALGGDEDDRPIAVKQTTDGGFIVAGASRSSNGDIAVHYGLSDYWIVKLDASGNMLWQKTLGGSYEDGGWDILETPDQGFVVCGGASSTDNGLSNYGILTHDFFIVKLTATGETVWQKNYGGSGTDQAFSMVGKEDGSFTITGYTGSTNHDINSFHGGDDYWLIHISAEGTLLWEKTYGGSDTDDGTCVDVTSDGGYVIVGFSDSNDGDVSGNHGDDDIWVIKTGPADDSHIIKVSFSFPDTLCPGENLTVNYNAQGAYLPGNTFTAQLSNSGGSFNAPIDIGMVTSIHSGQIPVTIPAVAPANSYHIRVVSSEPEIAGIKNTNDLPIFCPVPSGLKSNHITATSAKVRWANEKCGIGYQVRYRQDGNFQWTQVNAFTPGTGIFNLLPGTDYLWAVRTQCTQSPNSYSPWSFNQSFTTLPLRMTNSETDQDIDAVLQVYPNPAFTTINVKILTGEAVGLIITNSMGQVVFTQPYNSPEIKIDISSFATGMYFLQLKTSERIVTQRFVKN